MDSEVIETVNVLRWFVMVVAALTGGALLGMVVQYIRLYGKLGQPRDLAPPGVALGISISWGVMCIAAAVETASVLDQDPTWRIYVYPFVVLLSFVTVVQLALTAKDRQEEQRKWRESGRDRRKEDRRG